jgi:hypothetical protein
MALPDAESSIIPFFLEFSFRSHLWAWVPIWFSFYYCLSPQILMPFTYLGMNFHQFFNIFHTIYFLIMILTRRFLCLFIIQAWLFWAGTCIVQNIAMLSIFLWLTFWCLVTQPYESSYITQWIFFHHCDSNVEQNHWFI